jgi:hypothetical protein
MQLGGVGTQTAALGFGGGTPSTASTLTEEYNGSSWTASGNMLIAKVALGGAGTQTAGLAFAGNFPVTATTEEYSPAGTQTTKTVSAT